MAAIPPLGTPFLDPAGRVTRPWLAYFSALASGFSAAQPQTAGQVMSFPAALSPVVTGAAPFQVQVAGNQAAIDLWDVSSGAVTPAGGSRWRMWADNVGGGGGALTFGFSDVANSRMGAGFDSSGWLNLPNGLVISTPANITLGSGWLSWTPAFSSAGGMTITPVSIQTSQYIRLGPFVFVQFHATVTTSGTAAADITMSLPVGAASAAPLQYMSAFIAPGGAPTATMGRVNSGSAPSLFSIYHPGGGNYVLGAHDIGVNGFYRV